MKNLGSYKVLGIGIPNFRWWNHRALPSGSAFNRQILEGWKCCWKGLTFTRTKPWLKKQDRGGKIFLIPAPPPLNKTSEGTPRRKDRPGRYPYFGSESPASSIMILPFGLLQCKCKIIWWTVFVDVRMQDRGPWNTCLFISSSGLVPIRELMNRLYPIWSHSDFLLLECR